MMMMRRRRRRMMMMVVVMEEEEEDDDDDDEEEEDDDDDDGGGGGGGGGPVKVKSSTKKAQIHPPNTALKQGLGAPSFPDVSMTSGQIFQFFFNPRIRQALSTGIFPQGLQQAPTPQTIF